MELSDVVRTQRSSKPRISTWLRNAWVSRSAIVHPTPTSPPTDACKPNGDPVDVLIRANLRRQLTLREQAFRSDLPFSWLRFCVGLVSLALVFSDIPRSGLGIHSLSSLYTLVEPDVVSFYDPWNYTIAKLAKHESDLFNMHNQSIRVWSYKFDSTSIAWRALIRHFNLAGTTFPDCLLYTEPCPTLKLKGDVVFRMIDSLVDAVAATSTQTIQLRTVSMYVDRVHDFVLPPSFRLRHWRTNQALYYSAEELSSIGARLCHVGNRKQPNFCQERWVNYRRSCSRKNKICQQVGRILDHTLRRVHTVQHKFPDATVDLLFIESQEDASHVEGGLSMVGVRRSDISTIIRAQTCSKEKNTSECETIYVEDYRYQAGLGESDAVQWYLLIAFLRLVGQSYFIVRVVCLVFSCYYANVDPDSIGADKSRSKSMATSPPQKVGAVSQPPRRVRDHLSLATSIFSKIPTQCVVFGSPLPVLCYAVAHILDAPLTYVVLEKRFTSQNGILNLGLSAFISVAVVQMRNVWVYTLLLHCLVVFSTSRRWNGWCHLTGGVLGVPEFLLSGFSSITIAAQFRSTKFRNTRILALYPVETSDSHYLTTIKYQQYGVRRGAGNIMLGGIVIDLKCLVFLVITVSIALAIGGQCWKSIHSVITALRCPECRWWRFEICEHSTAWTIWRHNNYRWLLLGKTPVPYSARTLWPTVAMCVHWTSDFFCIHPPRVGPSIIDTFGSRPVIHSLSGSIRGGPGRTRAASASATRLANIVSATINVSLRMDYNTFSAIQLQMERVHDRRAVVEANVAFMNLVIMSDPLVYARKFVSLRSGGNGGVLLGYYRSKRCSALGSMSINRSNLLLLPREAVDDDNEHMQDLELVRAVSSGSLSWAELVQCG